jgi:basic membrane protein A and related proteins
MDAHISHVETRTPAEFEESFRQYGAQGYDLVIGHGFEFQDAAERVGPDFPGTVYVTSSGNRVGPNVAPIVFGFQDASWLAGVLAARLSRSGTLGVIGGQELPPVRNSFDAFAAGARSVRPDVRILTAYIGNWDDASAAREQALAQIGRGADLIFQNADAAGLGIFQAARQSRAVLVFGANSNQNEVAPDVIIGSVVIDLPRAFLQVAREVRAGVFEARVLYLGTRAGVVRLELNPGLSDRITPEVRAELDSVQRAISDGRIRPPRLEYAPEPADRQMVAP